MGVYKVIGTGMYLWDAFGNGRHSGLQQLFPAQWLLCYHEVEFLPFG